MNKTLRIPFYTFVVWAVSWVAWWEGQLKKMKKSNSPNWLKIGIKNESGKDSCENLFLYFSWNRHASARPVILYWTACAIHLFNIDSVILMPRGLTALSLINRVSGSYSPKWSSVPIQWAAKALSRRSWASLSSFIVGF